tara:strand:- start:8404 stop:8751 length:348 start_codon:yes stop_codon:yes gene_type:complete
MSRLQPVVDSLTGLEEPDDLFLEIMEALTDKEIVPEAGNYYTFIYRAKTPQIRYDEFPLIACTEVQRWGFKGFNYHWGKIRNYTWEEVLGQMHVVLPREVQDARSIPYAKFRLSP